MDEKWERFDNIIIDLWNFFLPPIINTLIILLVFPIVPFKIWGGVVYLIEELRNKPAEISVLVEKNSDSDLNNIVETGKSENVDNVDTKSIEKYRNNDGKEKLKYPPLIEKFENIFKNFGMDFDLSKILSDLTLPTFTAIAILIFILNKAVLWTSKLIFGKLEVDIECLSNHPETSILINKIRNLLPKEKIYQSVNYCWEYVKCINDTNESLVVYNQKRNKVISDIRKYRLFARYASAYFLFSSCSIILSISKESLNNSLMLPFFILIATIFAFIYFTRKFFYFVNVLIIGDIQTYLSVEIYNNNADKYIEEFSDDNIKTNRIGEVGYMDYVKPFDGNIFQKILDLTQGLRSWFVMLLNKIFDMIKSIYYDYDRNNNNK